jgi:hypothetical protein
MRLPIRLAALAALIATTACTSIETHRLACARELPATRTIFNSPYGDNPAAAGRPLFEVVPADAPAPEAIERCAQERYAEGRDAFAAGLVMGATMPDFSPSPYRQVSIDRALSRLR